MTDDHDDELDPDLGRFLRDRAAADERAAGAVGADEVLVRALPHAIDRRRPAVLAGVAAALLLTAVIGFAAGRGTAPSTRTTVAAGSGDDAGSPTTLTFRAQGYPVPARDGVAAPEMPTLAKLFTRTTSDGVTIRVYLQEFGGKVDPGFSMECPEGSWCPPPECNPTSTLVPELSTADAVSQAWVPGYGVGDRAAWASALDFGHQEQAITSVRGVRVADDVTLVTATWPDGTVDEMAPVDGWAVVAHGGDAVPRIVVTRGDGSTAAVDATDPYTLMPECQPPPPPPPTLPPPGEQPADVEAARAAVTAAFEQANAPGTVTMIDIVFTSPTEAYALYELAFDGEPTYYGPQMGIATEQNGTWAVTSVGFASPPNGVGTFGPAPTTTTIAN